MNTVNKPGTNRLRVCLLMAGLLALWSWNHFQIFQPFHGSNRLEAAAEADALEQAYAEADRLDPGWRNAQLQARRRAIPDDQNAALTVRAVRAALPAAILEEAGQSAVLHAQMLLLLENPRRHLSGALAGEVRAKLAKEAAALKRGQALAEQSWGRYPSTDKVSDLGIVAGVSKGYEHQALLAVHDGDIDAALHSFRILLTAIRSMGDQPGAYMVLVRNSCVLRAFRVLERTLAHGEPTPRLLPGIQQLLADMESDPIHLLLWRGERAHAESEREKVESFLANADIQLSGMTVQEFRRDFPGWIRFLNGHVEIAKLPLEGQIERLRQRGDLQVPAEEPVRLVQVDFRQHQRSLLKAARAGYRSQTQLSCARVALALERYRLAHGRWPDALDRLVPAFLDKVPLDLFTNKPLLYRKMADGVVVYSVGLDGVDDGGKFDRQTALEKPNFDIGFQLWDASQRPPPKQE